MRIIGRYRRMPANTVPEVYQRYIDEHPEFGNSLANVYTEARQDGELPAKFKTLIMMAIDGACGFAKGVDELAEQAREQGATEEEIREAIEIVILMTGEQGLYTSAIAYQD